MGGRIPLVLDGGPCAVGVESTVVAPRAGTLYLLRAGPVSEAELSGFAPVITPAAGSAIQAPGQLKSHYAPRTPLRLLLAVSEADSFDPSVQNPVNPQNPVEKSGIRVGLLAWSRASIPPQFAAMETLTPHGDPREAATRLFAAMRRLDALQLDLIVAEPPPIAGLGAAIMDRLRKAAA